MILDGGAFDVAQALNVTEAPIVIRRPVVGDQRGNNVVHGHTVLDHRAHGVENGRIGLGPVPTVGVQGVRITAGTMGFADDLVGQRLGPEAHEEATEVVCTSRMPIELMSSWTVSAEMHSCSHTLVAVIDTGDGSIRSSGQPNTSDSMLLSTSRKQQKFS